MNLKRYCLNKIVDEASEVIQAVSKVIEHGEDDYNPKEKTTCAVHLEEEVYDLKAVHELYNGLMLWLMEHGMNEGKVSEAEMRNLCRKSINNLQLKLMRVGGMPKFFKVVWFMGRAINRDNCLPEPGEMFWLNEVRAMYCAEIEEQGNIMREKFGLVQ